MQSDDFLIMFKMFNSPSRLTALTYQYENRKHCLFHMNVRLASEKYRDQQERWNLYLLCSGGRPYYSVFLTWIRNIRLQRRKIRLIYQSCATHLRVRRYVYSICRNAAVDVPDVLRTTVSWIRSRVH